MAKPVTNQEKEILDEIDLDGLTECLARMIEFQSLGGKETPIQEFVAEQMKSLGMQVDHWAIDVKELSRHPAYAAEIDRDEAIGVVGKMGQGSGRSLILNGHVDVVPAGELDRWSVPPWKATIENGRVYGRGSVDMKGALCCALFAIKAIRDNGIDLDGSISLQSVVGEEDGGMGTLAAIERGHTADAAIVMEPTEQMVAPAQAGAMNFRLIVPGKAAHGALRSEGVSPLDAFWPLYRAMRQFEAQRNQDISDPLFVDYEIPFALCIGKIWSGVWASTEAESLTCEGRLGVSTSEDPEEIRARFAEVITAAAQSDPWLGDHPPTLEWWGGQFYPATIDVDSPIVNVVSSAHQSVTGQEPVLRGMPYGADMRLLVNQAGIPTVLYGPGDVRRAHAPDEYVTVDELHSATRVLALSILRFCN